MTIKNLESIKTLLNEAQRLVDSYADTPLDCSNLKLHVFLYELTEEIAILNRLLELDADNFAEHFKNRCFERARVNEDSQLSFYEDLYGACNNLYWEMAEVLFGEQELGERLSILLPEKMIVIEPEFYLPEPVKPNSQRLKVKFHEKKVTDLNALAKREELANFVIYRSFLIDLREIASLDFHLHKTFYRELKRNYPTLVANLYQHNTSFSMLLIQLQIADGVAQSPKEAISSLVEGLITNGKSITGQTYATIGAERAFTDFLNYLKALPEEFKEEVLALTGTDDEVLSEVIDDLTQGRCVEIASGRLISILENSNNKAVLNAYPHLTSEQREALYRQYRKNSLPTMHGETWLNAALPVYYVKQLLPFIEINHSSDYINLLRTVPPSLYAALLQETIINKYPLPSKLAREIKNGLLDDEQKHAFYQAVWANKEKLGSVDDLLRFAVLSDSEELFSEVLKSVEPENRLKVLTCENAFYEAVSSPRLIQVALQLLPKSEYLLAMATPHEWSALYRAVDYPDSLEIMVQNLPEKDRFEVITTTFDEISLLHLAANQFSSRSLEILLQALPEEKRLPAIREKKHRGEIFYRGLAIMRVLCRLFYRHCLSS